MDIIFYLSIATSIIAALMIIAVADKKLHWTVLLSFLLGKDIIFTLIYVAEDNKSYIIRLICIAIEILVFISIKIHEKRKQNDK